MSAVLWQTVVNVTQYRLAKANGLVERRVHSIFHVSGTTTQERKGWHRLYTRLASSDPLVMVAIDRIGQRRPDSLKPLCKLRDRGVKIRSLADAKREWARYLEVDPGKSETFFGHILVMFAAWRARRSSPSSAEPGGTERVRQQGNILWACSGRTRIWPVSESVSVPSHG